MAKVEIPNNSNASKNGASQDQPKFEKVTKGKVTVKKKNELQKLADIFIAEDLRNVKKVIIYDMVIPAVRDLIVSIFTNSVNLTFYGQNGARPNQYNTYTPPPQTASYSRYYNQGYVQQNQAQPGNDLSSFQQITFNTRRDAEAVLDQMFASINQYGKVSIADYYDLVGISSDYTDFNYGWYDLRGTMIRPVAGGFMIMLPKSCALRR